MQGDSAAGRGVRPGPRASGSGRRRVLLGERLRRGPRRAPRGPSVPNQRRSMPWRSRASTSVSRAPVWLASNRSSAAAPRRSMRVAGRFAREGGKRAGRRDPDPVGAAPAEGGEQRRGPARCGRPRRRRRFGGVGGRRARFADPGDHAPLRRRLRDEQPVVGLRRAGRRGSCGSAHRRSSCAPARSALPGRTESMRWTPSTAWVRRRWAARKSARSASVSISTAAGSSIWTTVQPAAASAWISRAMASARVIVSRSRLIGPGSPALRERERPEQVLADGLVRHGLEEPEGVDVDRPDPLGLPVVARPAVGIDVGALERPDERAEVVDPADEPIGEELEAGLLLLGDELLDERVLDAPEAAMVELAAGRQPARVAEVVGLAGVGQRGIAAGKGGEHRAEG